MAAATLSVGVLLAILEAAPEIRVPFRVERHHSSKLGEKSQGGRRDRNQPYRESPQRECITLDRTRVAPFCGVTFFVYCASVPAVSAEPEMTRYAMRKF